MVKTMTKEIRTDEEINYLIVDLYEYSGSMTSEQNIDIYSCENNCPKCVKQCSVGAKNMEMVL